VIPRAEVSGDLGHGSGSTGGNLEFGGVGPLADIPGPLEGEEDVNPTEGPIGGLGDQRGDIGAGVDMAALILNQVRAIQSLLVRHATKVGDGEATLGLENPLLAQEREIGTHLTVMGEHGLSQ